MDENNDLNLLMEFRNENLTQFDRWKAERQKPSNPKGEVIAKFKAWFGVEEAHKIFNVKDYNIVVRDTNFIYVYNKD